MKRFGAGKKVFWGALFLLGAVAVLVGQMGFLDEIGFWNILVSVCMIGVLMEGVLRKDFGTILFSLAILVIVNRTLLGAEAITPWPVLVAALLGTIGLNILFPNHKWNIHQNNHNHNHGKWSGSHGGNSEEWLSGEDVMLEASFCETVKYISSTELSSAKLECSFGSLTVYFDNAVLKDGRATVYAVCSFGSMVLYVPANWKVEMKSNNAFGGIQEKGKCEPDGTNTLYIQGAVSFGSMEIRYI